MTPLRTRFAVLLLLPLFAAVARAAFVEFAFDLPAAAGNPFEREVRAVVMSPGGAERNYPAFYAGESRWRVRVRATTAGTYRLGTVSEPAAKTVGAAEVDFRGPVSPPTVVVDRAHPSAFIRSDGRPYLPLGLNLAWGGGDFHARSFAAAEAAGLNWARVWMASWSGAELDWLPPEGGPSPAPGRIDTAVAARWDRVLELAERHGIYVQVVLQQHGQFSTEVNPVWDRHPWNRANGGFLARPADFFTSPEAIQHTKTKYRYIIARYGHSPAVLAWELFNEVHFTDAWKHEAREDDIVRWHETMAAWLRAHDAHGHLVTTSADDLASPLWRTMDFYQVHLYSPNMLAHVRHFPRAPVPRDKPVFYGEIGDDQQQFATPADKASGAGLMPAVWAGLMAEGALPAQTWYWDRLLDTPRWAEADAWGKFAAAAHLPERFRELHAIEPVVETDARVPHVLPAGFHWSLRAPLDLRVPEDGREPAVLGDVPEYFVGNPLLVGEGRADRLTLRFDRPAASELRVHLTDVGADGLTLVVELNGSPVLKRTWPAEKRPSPDALRPADFTVALPAGPQVFMLRNRGPDSFRLRTIELGADVPALAAAGKRSDRFAMVYVWHRAFVHAAQPGAAVAGRVRLEGFPAGQWKVTWWDLTAGRAAETETLNHAGGTLLLPTPPVARHAAAFLECLP